MAHSSVRRVTTTTDDDAVTARIVKRIAESELTASAADVKVEQIRSYYWWDGAVQNDAETRVSFETTAPFETARDVVAASHSYDTPMIIAPAGGETEHWRGEIADATEEMAADLASSRLVACAQLAPAADASPAVLSVKTVRGAIPFVEKRVKSFDTKLHVAWEPIVGNQAYLDWLVEETKVPEK